MMMPSLRVLFVVVWSASSSVSPTATSQCEVTAPEADDSGLQEVTTQLLQVGLAMDPLALAERMNSSADIISVDGYETRADIPSGCMLEAGNKVIDGGRCVFSDQCVNKFCCPFLKICSPSEMSTDQVKADPLIKSILWSEKYGGAGTCGEDTCDVCAFRGAKAYQCSEVNGGPVLKGSEFAGFMPLYNTADPACNCDKRFIDAMEAGTWVDCKGTGTSGTPAAPKHNSKAAPAACENSATYHDPYFRESCAAWDGYQCTGQKFSKELIENCPKACGKC